MAKPTPTFYILHGEDEFSRKAQIAAMQDAMHDPSQLNTSILDGTIVSVQEVLNAASSYPFLSDKRLVIVDDMLTTLNKRGGSKAELDLLMEELPKLPDFARLVFHESTTLSEKNPVLALARQDPHGYEKNFSVPSNPAQWIMSRAKSEHGVEMDHKAASALASVINNDLRAADSEIAKLAAYVDYARPITEADVALLTPYVAEADIFAMVDAIGHQDGKTALKIAQNLLNHGNEVLSLLGMIYRQFRLLILAKEYLDGRGNPAEMGKALGVHDFVAKKIAGQARQFQSLAQLESIYQKLGELDYRIKTGKIEAEMALQLFIVGVTR